MVDKINETIANALIVEKDILNEKIIIEILKQIKAAIVKNKDAIIMANRIDVDNNNGTLLDFNVFDNIFSNIEKETIIYGNVTLSQRDVDNKIIYGKQIMDCGNVYVIYDGNPYITLEMILRNILAGNTTILVNSGYMYGTNNSLVQIVQTVFEQFNISRYLLQLIETEDYETLLSNFANIDLVVCIGEHYFQNLLTKKCPIKMILSGYENFDLYIEDKTHVEFIDKILEQGLNIQLYINSELELDYDGIYVDDIDEAIAQINYNGNRYSTSIFTDNSENAAKFIRNVKSKIVTVNTSPTIERIIDIKQTDLVNEKTIIYPDNYKYDGNIVTATNEN